MCNLTTYMQYWYIPLICSGCRLWWWNWVIGETWVIGKLWSPWNVGRGISMSTETTSITCLIFWINKDSESSWWISTKKIKIAFVVQLEWPWHFCQLKKETTSEHEHTRNSTLPIPIFKVFWVVIPTVIVFNLCKVATLPGLSIIITNYT